MALDLSREYFFKDPRLHMTVVGRFVVRVGERLGQLAFISASLTLLSSDLRWLNWLGLFLALGIIDRLIHIKNGDKPLVELPSSGIINIAPFLSPRAFSLIESSLDKSSFTKESVLLIISENFAGTKEGREALRRLDVSEEEFIDKAKELGEISREKNPQRKEEAMKEIEDLVKISLGLAIQEKQRYIEPRHIFAALPAQKNEFSGRLFFLFSINTPDLFRAILFSSARNELVGGLKRGPAAVSGIIFGSDRSRRHRIMNRAWTSRPTPFLDKVSEDLTDLARQGEIGFLIGHKNEYKLLHETICRPLNPNALLIGDSGIGKNAIVERLAFDIVKDKVPERILDKRLVKVNISKLVASAPPEELAQRIQNIVKEILVAGNVILYIPEIHNLLRTSGTAYLSAADSLLPLLGDDRVQVVGTTFPREFKQLIEQRSGFTAIFEQIHVSEISESEAEEFLAYESAILESHSKTFISFGAIKKAVEIAKKHFHTKYLPTSAEEILKSAVVRVETMGQKEVGPDEVILAAEEKINIPLHSASKEEAEKLLHLEEEIHKGLIGQEEAVKAIADSIREYRSGLSRQGGPIASFLFVGPTGVGKTELAKTLAKIQFGNESSMIRFDMTEYQDKQSFYRLIGSPDGSVSGALTEAVLLKPYSLVLLDEFEKAYPDILNLFLQVLDDGRLKDNLDRVIDFKNTIIIATSNAHSDIINDALSKGESMASTAEYLKRRLVDVFKPELINRFSKTIIFRDLSPKEVLEIAKLNLLDLIKKSKEQNIILEFEEGAIKQISKWGYEPAFGARPLRRVIEEKVRAPLAKKILESGLNRGASIVVQEEGGELRFILKNSFTESI